MSKISELVKPVIHNFCIFETFLYVDTIIYTQKVWKSVASWPLEDEDNKTAAAHYITKTWSSKAHCLGRDTKGN